MFTGLIKTVGEVRRVEKNAADCVITIAAPRLDLAAEKIGASIACNGVCLTVTSKKEHEFTAMVSAETLSLTTIGAWREGTKVNLETSLRLGDELGGHLVYGHVDAVIPCINMQADGTSWRMQFEVPPALKGFIATKGSVSLNGISLTVNEVSGARFGVNIIPHTYEHTNFSQLKAGDTVNLEIDMLARYMARMLDVRAA